MLHYEENVDNSPVLLITAAKINAKYQFGRLIYWNNFLSYLDNCINTNEGFYTYVNRIYVAARA